jgi:serine/threonine protein kinase
LLITYPTAATLNVKIDELAAAAGGAKKSNAPATKTKDTVVVSCSICARPMHGGHGGLYIKCNKCYNEHFCYDCWRAERHNTAHTLIAFASYKLDYFEKSELKIVKPIGQGNFGFVYQALLKPYGTLCACKLINKNISMQLHLQTRRRDAAARGEYDRFMSIDTELEAYVEIVSPFVCKLLGYGGKKPSKMFLVMEYMDNGSLEELILNEKSVPISLLDKFRIAYNVACGLADIHDKLFIHADLKPKNILLNNELTAKICDLGSAKNMNRNVVVNKQIGGLYYLPYEFYAGRYDEKIDVYSFGLVMYHLFSGQRHAYNPSGMLVLEHINLVPNNFVKALIWKATQFKPIRRGMIHYYRDIFKAYTATLRRQFETSRFDELYSVLTLQQRDLAIVHLNDALVEFVERKLSIKLAYDMSVFSLEAAGVHEEIRAKLERMVERLRAETKSMTSKLNIVELTDDDGGDDDGEGNEKGNDREEDER